MKTNGYDKSIEPHASAPPHFDDERTVLSARPVVPLEKIKARRYWLMGAAFVLAMVLGAGSAILASYLVLRNSVPETVNEVSQEEATPPPPAVAESVPSESPLAESPADESVEEASDVSNEPKKEPSVKRRTIVKHTPELERPRDEVKVDEGEDLQRIREAVLYDQWQERRARRVRRERRKFDRYNHRDLSNLDEIFEGRRKP